MNKIDIFENLRYWLNHVDPHIANVVIATFAGAAARHLAGSVFGFIGRRRRRRRPAQY